jgi:hypothetical protein
MENFDWSRFVTRIPVNATVESLYKSWASQQGMESWFLRLCEYKKPDGTIRNLNDTVEAGDTYKWLWHGWPDEMVETGSILDCNGKNFLKFKFGGAGDCSMHVKTEEGQNIVELLQENIPTDAERIKNYHLGCKTGWTFYLANLKSIMEGGIDLRNRDEKIQQVINS